MKQKTGESSAVSPLGSPGGRKLFRVETGQYAGRQVIVSMAAPGEIAYTYADRPYASWSAPVTVIADAADQAFDVAMAANGDLHVIYTDAATDQLATKRLLFANGVWSAAAKVTVCDQAAARDPQVVATGDGALWVCWTRVDLGVHTLYVKSSTDNGATWGSGPTDPGTALTAGASSVFGKLVAGVSTLWAIYANGSLQLSVRSQPLSGGAWAAESHLATGTGFDEQFDAAAASDGRVAVVWDNGTLRYREFDGDQWLPSVTLDENGGECPQLLFVQSTPLVVYLARKGADQVTPTYVVRQGGSFTAPTELDHRSATFESVIVYSAAAASFVSRTNEANGVTAGDVIHPASGVLMQAAGDAVYFGMDERFRYVKAVLSTAGAGGSVVWSYWNGTAWAAFTPATGAYHFDALEGDVLLWEDYNSVPADWQKRSVNGEYRFWVRAEVVSGFSVAPVGSQFTAMSDLVALMVRR